MTVLDTVTTNDKAAIRYMDRGFLLLKMRTATISKDGGRRSCTIVRSTGVMVASSSSMFQLVVGHEDRLVVADDADLCLPLTIVGFEDGAG